MNEKTNSPQKSLFANCRQLRTEGRNGEVESLLSDALRRMCLDPNGVLQAGRVLQKIGTARDPADVLRVTLLGQLTTPWLVSALIATARGRGQYLHAEDGDYDNVAQEIGNLESSTNVVVLLPWSQRLLNQSDRTANERIQDELSFWEYIWSIAMQRNDLHIVQVGYDWIDAGAKGHYQAAVNGGDIDLISRLNNRLRENLPSSSYFVDLEQVSGTIGRAQMYDWRRYFWTKQPFSDAGVVRLSEHIWAGVRAVSTGPKKVLVLDLDNTLWGGVVGELGPLGIDLGETPAGEAYRDFQYLAKSLAECGCLIAICSKNNVEDAREPFEQNPDMVLKLEDIVCFKAGWQPKVEMLREIADKLQLGLDSFVFFDDEPAERELIRQALPEVEVVEVPDDPADYRRALLDGLWFESVAISEEDLVRTKHYKVEQERKQSSPGSVDDYLRSLNMVGEINEIKGPSLDRVLQLVRKTNQFNLTTRRHTRETVVAMVEQSRSVSLTLRMRDRFGDYGLVAVIIAVQDSSQDSATLRIDTWLMSCRVIGRSAEQFIFNSVLKRARASGYSCLVGEYIATKKNAVVKDLYERLGFTRSAEGCAEVDIFNLTIADAKPADTFIVGASSAA